MGLEDPICWVHISEVAAGERKKRGRKGERGGRGAKYAVQDSKQGPVGEEVLAHRDVTSEHVQTGGKETVISIEKSRCYFLPGIQLAFLVSALERQCPLCQTPLSAQQGSPIHTSSSLV